MLPDMEQSQAYVGPSTSPGASEDEDSDDYVSSTSSSDAGSVSNGSIVSERAPSSTKSLAESTLEYVVENGRQYCNDSYHMPNDEEEQTRLNIQHQLHLLIQDGKLTLAPMTPSRPPRAIARVKHCSHLSYPSTISSSCSSPRSPPLRILDVGTGPADWAMGMAEQYPTAEVIATDISAAQHPESIPSNLYLEIDDATFEWTFAEQFDLIHIRNLSDSFPDWPFIYREAYNHLRPGGYIEVSDHDGLESLAALLPNSYVSIYAAATQSAAEAAGMCLVPNELGGGTAEAAEPKETHTKGKDTANAAPHKPNKPGLLAHLHPSLFEAAGFKNAQVTNLHVPLGTWPKNEPRADPRRLAMGKMWLIVVLEGLESSSLRRLTRELGWTIDAVRELCEKTRDEIMACHDTKRCETEFRVVVARKPEV